jgi:hypothetical protein
VESLPRAPALSPPSFRPEATLRRRSGGTRCFFHAANYSPKLSRHSDRSAAQWRACPERSRGERALSPSPVIPPPSSFRPEAALRRRSGGTCSLPLLRHSDRSRETCSSDLLTATSTPASATSHTRSACRNRGTRRSEWIAFVATSPIDRSRSSVRRESRSRRVAKGFDAGSVPRRLAGLVPTSCTTHFQPRCWAATGAAARNRETLQCPSKSSSAFGLWPFAGSPVW